MGRYPFVCAYRRYLKNARARLGESTIKERDCKLHFIASIVQKLNESGKISSPNPTLFTEDDIIEIFLAFKNRKIKGRPPKCSTLRKQMQPAEGRVLGLQEPPGRGHAEGRTY